MIKARSHFRHVSGQHIGQRYGQVLLQGTCSATCWLPYTNLELSRSLNHVFGNVCTVLYSEPEQHHICETIKQANFTPLTLDPTTTAYIQQIIGGLMDQLQDYL